MYLFYNFPKQDKTVVVYEYEWYVLEIWIFMILHIWIYTSILFSLYHTLFQRRSLHDVRYHIVIVYFPEFCKLPVGIMCRHIILSYLLLCTVEKLFVWLGNHGNRVLINLWSFNVKRSSFFNIFMRFLFNIKWKFVVCVLLLLSNSYHGKKWTK